MYILHVLAPAPVGGLESVVRALALGHSEMGHRVEVAATVDSESHPFVTGLSARGITVRRIRAVGRDYSSERRALREMMQSDRPDVLHSHGYRPDILDIAVAHRLGIPSVTTLHGFTGGDWKVCAYERMQLLRIRRASAVVAVSRLVADRVMRFGVPPSRLHLVRNAYSSPSVPVERGAALTALALDAKDFNVGWVGRLSHEKGPDVMIDAMTHLRDRPVVLSILGEGVDEAAVRERAVAAGVSSRVRFHGVVPEGARFLKAFDVVALSSRTEGTPMIILEAMAAETPIVATRVGGVPDMLSSSDAMLVEPDAPVALADGIRAVTQDADAARRRAATARLRLESEFNVVPWLQRYDAIYKSIQR